MQQPQIKDPIGWRAVLLEHRALLFEKVVAAFPEVLKKQRSKIDFWRARLRS